MFLKDFSSVVISEGCSYNGKIIYTTSNFSSMFLFKGKEILNCTIDDLIPDVVQVFHKYIIEDAIKFSNLSYIFKNQRNVLLKGKNGILFNIHLFVKPCPNLSFGLVYFLNIQKTDEKNIVLILDENLIIHGFTGLFQVNSNFTMNNNYGLSYGINGHHIGIIIPEILYYINYDSKKNIFTLNKNNLDLKGTLYPLINFQDFDNKITKILEIIKTKKKSDSEFSNAYIKYIKSLNAEFKNPYSIFFKIENHSFLKGKYHYYRIYIINDLVLGSGENSTLQNNKNDLSINNTEKEKEELIDDTYISNVSKNRRGTLYDSAIREIKEEKEKYIKSIPLKVDKKNELIKGKKNLSNEDINLIEKGKNNNIDIEHSESKKKVNNLDILLNYSKISNPSSVITQASTESNSIKFNKIKNYIINKNDSLYIRILSYISCLYIIIIVVLLIIENFINDNNIKKLVEYLRQNLYFTRTKIDSACVYNSFLSLKFIKDNFISDDSCGYGEKCHKKYVGLLQACLLDIRNQKSDMYYYYDDYVNIFNQKKNFTLYSFSMNEPNFVNLDLNNFLNLITTNAVNIYSNIERYMNYSRYDDETFNSYLNNVLNNTYNYFYSEYKGYYGEEKEKKCNRALKQFPLIIIIMSFFMFIFICLFIFFVYKIYNMERTFLDKLINFNSPNFEQYLKTLDELKKKFREDNNEEDDKIADDGDINKDVLKEEEDKSVKKKENSKKNKNINDNKSIKNKKNKINKLYLKKLEKKRIMSKYFMKNNILFSLKICLILTISIVYFIFTSIFMTKMKNDYYEFDSVFEELNKVYYDSYDIFLKIKKSIENYYSKNESMILQSDTETVRPKFGNILIKIKTNTKFSNSSLEKFNQLYNDNACEIFCDNIYEKNICEAIFSSVIKKGIEQAVVQMGVVLSSCLEELNSIQNKEDMKQIFTKSESYLNYETFMGKFLFLAYIETLNLFDEFRQDEKNYIINFFYVLLVVFVIIYIVLLVLFFYFFYEYKFIFNSFLNFIGILPSKFISDDDNFYQDIIQLQELY